MRRELQVLTDKSTLAILHALIRFTCRQFPNSNLAVLDSFIQTKLSTRVNKIIRLSEFLQAGLGVCRHHTLFNAFLLANLVKDGYLKGLVIHHRQNFPLMGRGHTWNLFKDDNGQLYSFDTLWRGLFLVNASNLAILDSFYHGEQVGVIISQRYNDINLRPIVSTLQSKHTQLAQVKRLQAELRGKQTEISHLEQLAAQKEECIQNKQHIYGHRLNVLRLAMNELQQQLKCENDQHNALKTQYQALENEHNTLKAQHAPQNCLHSLKKYIEETTFSVFSFGLFKGGVVTKMRDGSSKRLPHRVSQIYQMSVNALNTREDENHVLEQITQIARNALSNPRSWQQQSTKEFYLALIQNNALITEKLIVSEGSASALLV